LLMEVLFLQEGTEEMERDLQVSAWEH
jgi:hypothetical protein